MKSLTYVELDIDYCSLTYGVAPCTASLTGSPPTGTKKCFNSRITCQDIAHFTDGGATLRFAVNTLDLPKTIDCIPNIISVDFTPGTVSLGEDLGGRALLKVVLRDVPHSDTGTGFDKYLADRTYNPYEQGSLFGKLRARHPFLQGNSIRVIRGLVGQALADMETRHYIVDSFNGPGYDGTYELIANDVLKLADGKQAQAPLASTGTLSAAITNADLSMVLAPPGIGESEYPATGYLNISGEIVSFTRLFNATMLIHADVLDSPTHFIDVAGGHVVTANGNAVTDNAQSKFGGGSAKFDGTGDYLSLDGSSDFAFGTGDYTIDFWVRFNASPAGTGMTLADFRTASGDVAVLIQATSASAIQFLIGTSAKLTSTSTVTTATWYHIMVSRVSGNTKLFFNGTSEGGTYAGSDNLVVAAGRPRFGVRFDAALGFNGWLEEIRVLKGAGGVTANFTPPTSAYVVARTDNLTIARAQLGTTADAHDIGDRAQIVLRYVAQDPANIISDLLQNYAGVPSGYIPLASWLVETTSFLGTLYTASIAEPTSVATLLTELIDICALALWWDDRSQLVRLQVLRQISTTAARYTEDDRLDDSLTVQEQPEKRITEVWTYFAQQNPLLNLDQLENYASIAITADAEALADYGVPSIRKRMTRWIPTGGSALAQSSNAVQIARFRDPPRRIAFSLLREYSATQDPVLGGGYQLQAWNFQDDTGALIDVPIQITRLNPGPDIFQIEAEEMLFQTIVGGPSGRVIVIDSNAFDLNLRTLYDALYPAPVPGEVITLQINAGVIIGSTSATTPALTIGTWSVGSPPVAITVTGAGRIEGHGGNGGNFADLHFGTGAGRNGGTALYTRQAITISMSGGQIWSGGGGGGAHISGGGGGGGGGSIPGIGGAGITSSYDGASGTTEAGGAPGAGGGTGGAPGFDATTGGGTVGGVKGAAIDGNSFCTFAISPNIRGTQVN